MKGKLTMTSKPKTIYQKLANARKDFHQNALVKTGHNDYSNYDYFELSDFLIPALEILEANDLITIISFETELATMRVIDLSTGEEFVITSPMSTAVLKACQPVQSMGACQTFVRRYLYVTLFEIVEHDAIEETTGKPEPSKPKAEKKPVILASKEQWSTINDYIKLGALDAAQIKWVDSRLTTLTERQAINMIKKLDALEKTE